MLGERSVTKTVLSHDQSLRGFLCPSYQLRYFTSRHCKYIIELCDYIKSNKQLSPHANDLTAG